MNFSFLTFSDAGKFALIAKNIVIGNGFVTDFSFWGQNLFATNGIPFLTPYLISFFMRIFGINDKAVISFSFFFYLSLLVSVFLLAKKIFSVSVGFFSTLVVAFDKDIINYARSGASENLFAFEIVIATYLFSFKKIWINVIGLFFIVAMYFTRPQAFIFIITLIFYWLMNRIGIKKAIIGLLFFVTLSFFVDKLLIYPLSFKFPLTSVYSRGLESVLTYSSTSAISDSLRGSESSTLELIDVFKKLFYNLYNFYKLMPQIMNPYIFTLFIIGIFLRKQNIFKIYVLSSFFLTLIVTALTIPFFRYLHPTLPLIYILGVGSLFKIFEDYKFNIYISGIIVFIISILPTLGVFLLDSRFERKIHNINKPPVYVLLSQKLKTDTQKDSLILTNLDTWGSWYGERKTVWFPLEPKMITGSKFDYIYLTSYKIDDENYYMGESWRKMFNDPTNQNILPDYKLYKIYSIDESENYERENAKGVLFIKK